MSEEDVEHLAQEIYHDIPRALTWDQSAEKAKIECRNKARAVLEQQTVSICPLCNKPITEGQEKHDYHEDDCPGPEQGWCFCAGDPVHKSCCEPCKAES